MNKVSVAGTSEPAPQTAQSAPRTYEPLGNDRLMSIKSVSEVLGVCPVTASKIIKESGRGILLHRRLFILESSFMAYLREQEATAC